MWSSTQRGTRRANNTDESPANLSNFENAAGRLVGEASTPTTSKDDGLGKLGTVLEKINSKTLEAGLSKTYYWMMYGSGSDFLDHQNTNPKDDENVSGWHFWNSIDPKDNYKR